MVAHYTCSVCGSGRRVRARAFGEMVPYPHNFLGETCEGYRFPAVPTHKVPAPKPPPERRVSKSFALVLVRFHHTVTRDFDGWLGAPDEGRHLETACFSNGTPCPLHWRQRDAAGNPVPKVPGSNGTAYKRLVAAAREAMSR